MKNLLLSLLCVLLTSSIVFAEENKAEQTQTVENNKAVFDFQKTPANATTSQKQTVKGNWFCIIIQNNGKIPFDKTENK